MNPQSRGVVGSPRDLSAWVAISAAESRQCVFLV